jgi:hypothetical protein
VVDIFVGIIVGWIERQVDEKEGEAFRQIAETCFPLSL